MPTIGEELQIMLGMVPVRDRAGIARSNLAQEAQQSASAQGLEISPDKPILPPQPDGSDRFAGMQPPPLQLPDDMNVEYASGKPQVKGNIVPPVPGGPPTLPVPSERVVASSPAAAPSPAVRRNSDLILEMAERRKRAQNMEGLFASIGLLANAFNRNPSSAASTRNALASMADGSGGGGGGNNDALLLKALDMRTAEDTAAEAGRQKANAISVLKKRGYSDADAEVLYHSNKYADYFGPAAEKEAEEKARTLEIRRRLNNNAAEIAVKQNRPIWEVRADIDSDKLLPQLEPKYQADLLNTLSTTRDRDVGTNIKIADQQRAEQARQLLDKPEAIQEVMRRTGMPEFQVRAGILNGDIFKQIDPKELAEIQDKSAQTKDRLSQTQQRDQTTSITGFDFNLRKNAVEKPEETAQALSKVLRREVSPTEVWHAAQTEDTYKDFIKQMTQGGQAKIGDELSQTAKRNQDVEGVKAARMSFEDAKNNRGRFMEINDLSPSAADKVLVNQATFDKFTADQASVPQARQKYEYDRARERAKGPEALQAFDTKYPDLPAYERSAQQARVSSPGDDASKDIIKKVGDKYVDWHDEVEKSNIARESTGHELFQAWSPNIRSGGSAAFAEKENQVKKTLSRAFGREDIAGEKTDKFFAILSSEATSLVDRLPGALSDKDVRFIKEQAGSKEMSPQTLRKLMIINDNIKMAQDQQKRELIIRAKQGATEGMDEETVKALKRVPTPSAPKPNWFVTHKLANDPEEVALIIQNRNNPEFLRDVDHEWGRHASRYVLEKYDREQAAKGGR
jgi:hypothetical protein